MRLQAIQGETNSLMENYTQSVVKDSEHAVELSTRQIFRCQNEEGATRYKARLLARGFSPMMRYNTLRILLAITLEIENKSFGCL